MSAMDAGAQRLRALPALSVAARRTFFTVLIGAGICMRTLPPRRKLVREHEVYLSAQRRGAERAERAHGSERLQRGLRVRIVGGLRQRVVDARMLFGLVGGALLLTRVRVLWPRVGVCLRAAAGCSGCLSDIRLGIEHGLLRREVGTSYIPRHSIRMRRSTAAQLRAPAPHRNSIVQPQPEPTVLILTPRGLHGLAVSRLHAARLERQLRRRALVPFHPTAALRPYQPLAWPHARGLPVPRLAARRARTRARARARGLAWGRARGCHPP